MTDIIEQWNTKTLGGTNELTISDFELIQDPIHLQKANYSALEVVDLIGRVTNTRSSSGPLPGTGQILNFTADTAGAGTTLLQPGKGEVWSIVGASYIVSGISGSINHLLYLDDATGAVGGTVVISEKSSSDSGDNFGDVDYSPLHLDENMTLQYTFYGTCTSVSVRLACIRVR